jgi:hypothetical protein
MPDERNAQADAEKQQPKISIFRQSASNHAMLLVPRRLSISAKQGRGQLSVVFGNGQRTTDNKPLNIRKRL